MVILASLGRRMVKFQIDVLARRSATPKATTNMIFTNNRMFLEGPFLQDICGFNQVLITYDIQEE
jgi:hypothetical protein